MEPFDLEPESKTAQDKGAPIPITPLSVADGGAYFIVRRIGTRQFKKEISEIRKEKEDWFNAKSAFDEQDVLIEWLWRHGITGWSECIRINGEFQPYSRGLCKQIVTDESYIGYVHAIISGAQNQVNYLELQLAEIADAIKKL